MPPEKENKSTGKVDQHSSGWFRPMADHLTELLNTEIFPSRGSRGSKPLGKKASQSDEPDPRQKAIDEVESYADKKEKLETVNPMTALSSAAAASRNDGGTFNADRIARLMMQDALREGTSDIHLEPYSTGLHVRMRLDGVLHDTTVLTHAQGDRLIRFFKSLAGMDPVATFVPHDGRAQYEVDGKLLVA